MSSTDTPSSTFGDNMFRVGAIAQIGGSIISSIGAYAGAEAQQAQLISGAMTDEHRAVMADLGAAQAQMAADSLVLEGRKARAEVGLRAAQEQGSDRASAAARGVQGGVGSAADVQASLRLVQEIEQRNVDSQTLRQKQALERESLSRRNTARQLRVSAQNRRDTASALNPAFAAFTSALQGAGAVAGTFARRHNN